MGIVNLHLYPSDFTHESRMLRETKTVLDADLVSDVLIAATWSEGLAKREMFGPNREVHRIPTRLSQISGGRLAKVASHVEWMLRVLLRFGFRRRVDVVSCHSLTVLPIGALLRLFRRTTVVYTPHELETEVATPPIPRPVGKFIERRLIGLADSVIVVGELIGQWYVDQYGLDDVDVVRNIPPQLAAGDASNILRDKLGIPDNELIFLYQGGIHDGRGINVLLAAFAQVPADRHVVFLGYGGMQEQVEAAAHRHANIHYLRAVPPDELPHYTASADVGLSLIENISLSYYYSLPNKLFEYMQAGIPVISSDFPEVAELYDRFDFGWLSPVEDESVAKIVTSITADELETKETNAKAAAAELSWDNERPLLVEAYRRAMEGRS